MIKALSARLAAGALISLVLSSVAISQGNMAGMQMDHGAMKMSPDPLGVSMERAGSGTTWTPDAVRLPSLHFMAANWSLMVHGFVFGQYTDQGGPRGGTQAGSLNWGMFMATHDLAGGRLSFRTMLSLDPWTVTPRGYPLLLQTGESFDGEPLHDRQHPHDFWMELAAVYEREITKSVGVSLYAAPSGEPALAPVAFMHRPSAMDLPFAPLGHHWQDATHVAFGVVTVGLFGNKWKLEGSSFNGREPDQNRWDIETGALDSWSGRLTINPSAHWSATAGYGYLRNPENDDPLASMNRMVFSLQHGAAIGGEGQVASTIIVGANMHDRTWTSMALVESEAVLDRRNTLLGRFEFGVKTADDLHIPHDPGFQPAPIYSLTALTVGYIRELLPHSRATLGIGVMGSVSTVPLEIADEYGSRRPAAFTVFARMRPAFRPRR